MLQIKSHRFSITATAVIAPLVLFASSSLIEATTSPAPGKEIPDHVLKHLSRSQVSLDSPGAWRGKAKAARDARKSGQRSSGAVTGVLDVPVFCFGFNNVNLPADTVANLQTELFDGPWPTGTLSEYYREVSYGKFTFSGVVSNIGNLTNNDTFYEGGSNGMDNDEPFVYVTEALQLADATTDFTIYDNDGPDGIPNSGDDDGIVDLVALVHPESGGECLGSNNLWSHRWSYGSANFWATGTNANFITDDDGANGSKIQISDYTIMPALSCEGTLIEIGVFCHEFGHALGIGDLYGTNGSTNDGCGHFCLMGSGNWNSPSRPSHMSAWCRAELGWIEPQLVIGEYSDLMIPAIEEVPFALKIQHDPNSSEYLLIENRQPIGFDENLWACGLAIWHVDPSVGTGNDFGWCGGNAADPHSMIALEQSDGLCDIENDITNRGDVGDLWSANSPATVFDPNTFPNSRPYSGVNTGVKLADISACGDDMTIDLSVNPLPIQEPRELDVLFIFDTSGSYSDDLPNMLAQMPSVMDEISNTFPNPRYAVANFTDFPILPAGNPSDEAWIVDLDFTSNEVAVTNAMAALTASGGQDLPESQYEAIYQAMMGTGLDLNGDGDFSDTGDIAPQPLSWDSDRAPIIFLMTDAEFHDADIEDYPVGTGEANGRAALLAEIGTPTVMAETPRIFTLNAAWEGPDITSGEFGSGHHSSSPWKTSKLHEQATELAAHSRGSLIYAGDNTIEFKRAVKEALDLLATDITAAGTCCTWDGGCQQDISSDQCRQELDGVWSGGDCQIDCNENNRPDTCEIALNLVPDINNNDIPDGCECLADINGDGAVNVDDMLKIIGEWGCRDCPRTDINQDGITNVDDLLIAFDGWGDCR